MYITRQSKTVQSFDFTRACSNKFRLEFSLKN